MRARGIKHTQAHIIVIRINFTSVAVVSPLHGREIKQPLRYNRDLANMWRDDGELTSVAYYRFYSARKGADISWDFTLNAVLYENESKRINRISHTVIPF